jgi:hypothetical protein
LRFTQTVIRPPMKLIIVTMVFRSMSISWFPSTSFRPCSLAHI